MFNPQRSCNRPNGFDLTQQLRARVRKYLFVTGILFACLISSSCNNNNEETVLRKNQNSSNIEKTESFKKFGSWSNYGGDSTSSQYSSLNQINRNNVKNLEVAWMYPTGKKPHLGSPLIVDDVMFVTKESNGLAAGVAAIDAATGEQKWFTPNVVNSRMRGFSYWRSVDAYDERLFFTQDDKLVALNPRNGKLVAEFGNNGRVDLRRGLGRNPKDISRIASQTPGRIFENLIIVGSAVGEDYTLIDDEFTGAPGDIRAYDVRDGSLVWSFHTIPHPGEYGYDTWPEDAWKVAGGANAWSTMSLDEERGIIYIPTGAPIYHYYGGDRTGDNLFSSTLLALDARTGKRIWHFQAVRHDIWDYDLAMAPKLLAVDRDGEKIDAVALATKSGFMFVFNRETGEPVFPIEYRQVPASDVPGEHAAKTQPFPTHIPAFAKQALTEEDVSPFLSEEERKKLVQRIKSSRYEGLYTPPSMQGTVQVPGPVGGANFGNGAVDPQAGLFYLAVLESSAIPKIEIHSKKATESFLAARTTVSDIYTAACAGCHGATAKGQPPTIPSLRGVRGRMSVEEFNKVVSKGLGIMPGFQVLSEVQLWSLMHFVDGLSDEVHAETTRLRANNDINNEDIPENERRYWSNYNLLKAENGLPQITPPWMKLVAYDLNQGSILWEKPYGDVIKLAKKGITGTGALFSPNSLVATAGGLLFSTTSDRQIRAWDRETGGVLWSENLPADPKSMPAVYSVGGRQFIVAAATYGDVISGEPVKQNAYIAFSLPPKDRD